MNSFNDYNKTTGSNGARHPDPMGWAEAVKEALAEPALEEFNQPETQPSASARAAAYQLAVALGRCRVFGQELPEDLDGVLPAAEAVAAAQQATILVQRWVKDLGNLGMRWDEAIPEVAESMCAEVLEERMELQFVVEAVSEAYQELLEEGDAEAAQLEAALDELAANVERFDEALQQLEILALLSTVVDLPLLDNWRAFLSGPYREMPPWWLDGTLEAVAEERDRVVVATLPRAEVWRQISAQEAGRPAILHLSMVSHARHVASLIFNIAQPIAVAADTPVGTPEVRALLRWRSPDGRLVARLSVPREAYPEDRLVLELLSGDESREATELRGKRIWLGGVEAQVEEKGIARIPLGLLRESLGQPEAELTLEVEHRGEKWLALTGDEES